MADTTQSVAAELAELILAAAKDAATEQALVVAVETALGPVLEQLKIPKHVEYEKTLLQGRADAVYGSVIIEYESPGKLATVPGRGEAFGQARQYMREEAELRSPGAPQEALPKLVGVVLDGFDIGFVLWRPGGEPDADLFEMQSKESQLSMETEAELEGRYQQLGPFPVSVDSITDFLRFLRALSRRPLEAKAIAEEFGPQAATAQHVVRALDEALKRPSFKRTTMLYTEWLRLFGAIYGDASKVNRAAVTALAKTYSVTDDDVGRMLFAVHTYFALIMKILAVELVALQSGAVIDPLVAGLADQPDDLFDERFRELESGATFRARGIENFLEGDFLGWYADEWTAGLRTAVRALVRELQDFEPGTSSLRPELTQDLLKELYHRLLPRELRHALGEYYTPDWLAEYTMNRSGYDAQPGTRMLDPACGSGTFLVVAIRRMRENAEKAGMSPAEAATAIVDGIHGFDLNPLAVIAARTNYLLAAGDLVSAIAPFRIPVFNCDSISVPARPPQGSSGRLQGKQLQTSVGDFYLPDAMAAPTVLPGLMEDLEFCADSGFTTKEFLDRPATKRAKASAPDLLATGRLFDQICQLKADGRDGIWPRLLINAFAPVFARGGFDHVIGNPPWISWEEVSQQYRDSTKPLWSGYGLFTLSGRAARLGGGKKDMSMLMTNVAAEEYLKPNGVLTFLITQTVLQTSGAGEGFRQFHTNRRALKVRCADDLANFNPFDDAANWSAIISLQRDALTTYPVEYRLWSRKPQARMSRHSTLAQALKATDRTDLLARPVRSGATNSPWLIGKAPALNAAHSIAGASDYQAKAGITVWLDGVFQVEVLGKRADGLIRIRNHHDVGKTTLPAVEDAIEPDLLFPYVPWARLGRWDAQPDRYLIVPQDPATRAPYSLDEMRARWPQTLAYLKRFEEKLKGRSGYKRYFNSSDPFYAIYNVSNASMSATKVAWRTMGTSMQATILSSSTASHHMPSKTSVFKNTVVFVPVESDEEAQYLTALLNCSWADWLLRASNVRGGKSAFATNVLGSIAIPTYSRRSAIAKELSWLGGRAAEETSSGDGDALLLTEAQIDDAAARFWKIGKRNQAAITESLAALG